MRSSAVNLELVRGHVGHAQHELHLERGLPVLCRLEGAHEPVPQAHDRGIQGQDLLEGPQGGRGHALELERIQ